MSDHLPVGCDLLSLREHVRDVVRLGSQQAEADGATFMMPRAVLGAIETFLEDPTPANAEALLVAVPPLRRAALECSPVGQAVDRLQEAVIRTALTSAQTLDTSIRATSDADRHERRFLVQCEWLYFFIHLAGRVALHDGGRTRQETILENLTANIPRPFVQAVVGHWPKDMQEKIIQEFIGRQSEAEHGYAACGFPVGRTVGAPAFMASALVQQFAQNMAALLGVEDDYTMAACRTLAHLGWAAADLPARVQAIR